MCRVPVATVNFASVQVVSINGVQAALTRLTQMRGEARWLQAELLTKPGLVFGLPQTRFLPSHVHGSGEHAASWGVREHVSLWRVAGACGNIGACVIVHG